MDVASIAKAVLTVGTPLATLIGVGGRRRRLRNEIKENLAIVEELEKKELIRDHTPAVGWLQGRIVVDVGRLARVPLGTPKKPIRWGSVAFGGILAVGFSVWTAIMDRHGFVWYSIFPGAVAVLMALSTAGQFMNREMPPDQTVELPPGAVPVQSANASEHVASMVALKAAAGSDDRFEDGGQVITVYKFVGLMQAGRYEEGLALADPDWRLARLQSWIWNNQDRLSIQDDATREALAESLFSQSEPRAIWDAFVSIETGNFAAAWGGINLDKMGAASHRRRISRDCDLVILAPVGDTGGYFVPSAVAVPNALIFVLRRRDGRWLVANHGGAAPVQPGWPPAWWTPEDAAVQLLPDS